MDKWSKMDMDFKAISSKMLSSKTIKFDRFIRAFFHILECVLFNLITLVYSVICSFVN